MVDLTVQTALTYTGLYHYTQVPPRDPPRDREFDRERPRLPAWHGDSHFMPLLICVWLTCGTRGSEDGGRHSTHPRLPSERERDNVLHIIRPHINLVCETN